jgi:hypothetical protein
MAQLRDEAVKELPEPPRCSRCRIAIMDTDVVLREHGEWYHVGCARTVTSFGMRDEPSAVLCVICRTGIRRTAQLTMTESGPAHPRCRPAPPD